jgi:hypothetical protein
VVEETNERLVLMKKSKTVSTPPPPASTAQPSVKPDLEEVIKECRALCSKVFRFDAEAEMRAMVGANEKLAKLVATGVKKIKVNKGQTSLTVTFGNGKVVPFTVNDVCKAWIGYDNTVYNSRKDPVMKLIWKEKEEAEAKLRSMMETVPETQRLRALGLEK